MHKRVACARWGIVLALCALLIVSTLAGCGRKPSSNGKKTDESSPVSVTEVMQGSIRRTVDVTGTLEADNTTVISAKVGGRVASILVDAGDRVAVGQALVILDDSDIKTQVQQAQAAVRVADARLDQAKAALDVTETRGETDLQQAKDAQTQAQSRLDLVRQGAREEERRQAEEAVNAAQAGYDAAKADYDRAAHLLGEGAISKQTFDNAKARYEAAQSQLRTAEQSLLIVRNGARPEEIRAAEAALSQAQQAVRLAEKGRTVQLRLAQQDVKSAEAGVSNARANLTFARQQLADTIVAAPYPGTIATKDVGVGQVVAPSVPLMTIVGSGQFSFVPNISEKDYAGIFPGQKVAVQVDAFPESKFDAVITSLLPSADTGSRSFKSKIQLRDPSGRIRQGMFARGQILVESEVDTLLIPSVALVEEDCKFYVYVVDGDKARRREVTLGITNTDDVEITKGLSLGDQVITAGQTAVSDGSKIRITK